MHELIATCWTHAGDAAPMRDGERSPLDILDRVRVAADTGFAGFGIVYADLLVARETIGWERLAREIRAAGFRHTEVEFLDDWWATGERRAASDVKRGDLLAAAELLEARFVKVSGSMTEEPARDLLIDAFRGLCDDAERAGTRIALEPLPFTNFRTVPEGARFVQDAGHPAGGVIIDVWHVFRAGQTPADLLGAVAREHLFGAELNDALEPAPPADRLFADTINARLPPGEGDWDIPGFVNALREIGYDGPWGVEIISEAHRALPLEEALRVAFASGSAVLDEAHRRRP
ncbi:sugar phosphate isomerase/epimerase family protein [Microbacterium sp. No. 7]|uniref:sugar phosphate isomerase/epimerase family protein n=1 Tax=Microbacterium sp. No. 7 TaxID=1714373 RepID=UPI0006D085DF|nr:sugar phosphate isomerase/epimerase family protein [Microbacterium sp. No. 7]ALJ21758.1 hypothetical protein AOA12_18410 [Microbacterium sp. No. 7]